MPPNGWGAVEKITWSYYLELKKLGHDVNIPYINEVEQGQHDIVHVHVWNHALEMKSKNIPYIFTCHDHHAYVYGKNSTVYKNNMEAIRHADLAIVPAKYLVEYFDNLPVYLEHGVDTEYFQINSPNSKKRLLCVGNNGLIEEKTFDRKGFRYAIESSKKLKMPITIVGPTNVNKQFFEKNVELIDDNVNVLYDLSDEDLRNVYMTHDILVHATSIEAGHPPLTILEAASSGLPVITTDCAGDLHITKTDRTTESVSKAISYVLNNYEKERKKTIDSVKKYDWKNVVSNLNDLYINTLDSGMRNSAIKLYRKIRRVNLLTDIHINFIDGPFVEVKSQKESEYVINFIDSDTENIVYSSKIPSNHWSKSNRKWFTNWKITIQNSNEKVYQHQFDAKNKRVFIVFESSSVGDTIAWIPYVNEFRLRHNCHVIVSTFHNDLFESEYPEIEFVKPGSSVDNLYALYRLGVFYDSGEVDFTKHKTDFKQLRLQEYASDILGLDYEEIRPRIKQIEPMSSDKAYICIANHSTAQSKYWNNPTGWQELVDYVKSLGYDVYLLSREEDGYMGNKNPKGVIKVDSKSLEEIGSILLGSKGFIGLSSGLSWLSWGLNVPTVLISGVTDKMLEPTSNIYRVINEDVCHGCFARHLFDRGDWNWCPDHKGTDRQFECTKSITFQMVKPKIDKMLNI
jgi:autotransporter strand-loop-strand O-heptosyltransferase